MDRLNEFAELSAPVEDEYYIEPYEAPRGELECAIAGVWREVFELESVGRNDNFFGLGGNSLLAMKLTEMLAERLAIEVAVVVLFQYPSIRELAEAVTANGDS